MKRPRNRRGSRIEGGTLPGTFGQPQQQISIPATAARHASIESSSSETTEALPIKKRKLRKGTFSCIECKRRKVRCHFADGNPNGEGSCASCQRHGTPCIGQEYEAPSPPPLGSDDAGRQRKYSDVSRKIREVEALVNELMCRQIISGFPTSEDSDSDDYDCDYGCDDDVDADDVQDNEEDAQEQDASDTRDGAPGKAGAATWKANEAAHVFDQELETVLQEGTNCFSHWMHDNSMASRIPRHTPKPLPPKLQAKIRAGPEFVNGADSTDDDDDSATVTSITGYDRPISPTTQIRRQLKKLEDDLVSNTPLPHRASLGTGPLEYHTLNKQLQSVLPTIQGTLRILNRGALYTLGCYRSYIMSSNGLLNHTMALQKSSTGHPILLARELIQLAVCLQLMVAENTLSDMGLAGVTPLEMADRYYEIAYNLVTSQDSMIKSQEGLESVFLEAYYQANKGNVRGSWMAMRRGLYIAQQMGLPPPSWTGYSVSLHSVWTSILFGERFLSLMLGVPPYTVDDQHRSSLVPYVAAASTIKSSQSDSAGSDLKRLQALIIPRISARNERLNQFAHPAHCGTEQHRLATQQDYQETRDIDYSFQQVAKTLPAKWWVIPNITGGRLKGTQEVEETTRLMTQAKHYNLLVLLHLPYLTERRPGFLPVRPPPIMTDSANSGSYPHEFVVPPNRPEHGRRSRSSSTSFRDFGAAINLNYARPTVSEDLAVAFGIRPGEVARSIEPVPALERLPPWNALCMTAPPRPVESAPPPVQIVLSSSQPPDMTFSRLGALGAAREVLCRFLVFRHCTKIASRCHAFDFEAFVACIAVLLAHLDTHTRGRHRNDNTTHYQRPTDINTVEQAIDLLELVGREMKHESGCMARASLLRRLVAIEAEAAAGVSFDVWTEEGTLGRGDGTMTADAHNAVQTLSMPYYGLLHVRRL
ncbi:c6 zinc finger domain containing protein [Ophiostoma piceae UAMH 11346]|uniref:C6 zinc finger domain containing protein n=1 Tax=Ophiostoma piceae (strain UAMH 11346) TaxID=1262450 RepID=S3C8T1_OPHP1|nr:c6 zinc finger domain containing protein [Ophiostoma piceae UAMH 11346]